MDVVDALAVGEIPGPGQGHFHCSLDGGAIVASVSPRLDWHELASGTHTVACYIANNAHLPASSIASVAVDIV